MVNININADSDSDCHWLSAILGVYTSIVGLILNKSMGWSYYKVHFTNKETDQGVNWLTKSYQQDGREWWWW